MRRKLKRRLAGKDAGGAVAAPGQRRPASGWRKRRWLVLLLALAVAGAALYLLRRPVLAGLGRLLVVADPLEKADAALVLSGDDSYEGVRVRAGVELYRRGWVRKLVLSGGKMAYGMYETELSQPLAIAQGVSKPDIVPIAHSSRSTQEEAELIAPLLERKGIRSFYVVSSSYHTRRARRLFIRASGGRMRVLAYPAADPWFDPDRWWHSREGRKKFLEECLKHINSLLE